jgi:hypothetical protein
VRLAFCWSHCRRYFYDAHQTTQSPIAFEALQQIGRLYAVETQIRGRPAEERLAARHEHSRPVIEALRAWLPAQLERVSGKSGLAEAIRYALRHWDGLNLFLENGAVVARRSGWESGDNLDESWCRGVEDDCRVDCRAQASAGRLIAAARQLSAVFGVARVGGRPGPRLRSRATRRR